MSVHRAAPLLRIVAGLLERTYRVQSGLGELGRFIIGDAGFRALYGPDDRPPAIRSATLPDAMTLVRELGDGVRVCVYFPDAMIRTLEAFPPQLGVGEENLDEFSVFVEEVDHLLTIAECSRIDKPVSLFELELHANVSKHLVLTRFLAGSSRSLEPVERVWLRRRLFDGHAFVDEDPVVRRRYRDALRWAVRLIDRLPKLDARARLKMLRRFHSMGAAGKLELIQTLAP